MALEELSYKMKILSKDNEELSLKNEKLIIENKIIAQKIEQKYEDKIMDLEERVEEYRFIIVTTKLYVETKRFINHNLPKIN